MAFTYTVSKSVFDENSLLPGTCVHFKSGTVADGTFKEGNGIVLMCTPLTLEIELYNIHAYQFERISIPVEHFTGNLVTLKVLTIEDGVGTEPTGAIPTDIYPPGDVTNLRVEHTDTTATFYWTNPTEDFHHVKVLRDGMLVADNVTVETLSQTTLAAGVTYTYTFIVVDAAGNESAGKQIIFTMNLTGDTTVNTVFA